MAQLDWNDACEMVKSDDGLIVRDVGAWSEDKLHVWHKYIQTTTTAMAGQSAWKDGLCYVDLFAGPGICRVRDAGKRLPGSPLIAARAAKPFRRIILVEKDANTAHACEQRMRAANATTAIMLVGDSNQVINDVVREIAPGALTLAFIDPEGLDVHFDTVRRLAESRRVDLLILFADAYDAVRNLELFLDGRDTRLDVMFGSRSKWKDKALALPNHNGDTLRKFFSEEYIDVLKSQLGYTDAAVKIIEGPKGPLYRLIYATKSPRGLDFWRKVDHRDRTGQGGLFGP